MLLCTFPSPSPSPSPLVPHHHSSISQQARALSIQYSSRLKLATRAFFVHPDSSLLMDCTLAAVPTSICPSKTDMIMSRYRPISPKPASFASSSSHAAADPVDGAATILPSFPHCFPQVPQIDRNVYPSTKRTRKRKRDISTIGLKGARKKGCAVMASLAANRGCNSSPMGSHYSAETESASLTLSCLSEVTRLIHEDEGFMARAAASAPSCLLPDRLKGSQGAFTEMIRGITGLSTAAGVHNLMHQSSRAPLVNMSFAMPSSSTELVNTASVESACGLSPVSREQLPLHSCKPIADSAVGNAADTDLQSHVEPSCDLSIAFSATTMVEEGLCVKPSELGLASTPHSPSDVEFAKEAVEAGLRLKEDCADQPVTLSLLPEIPELFDRWKPSLSIAVWDEYSYSFYNRSPEPVALLNNNFDVLWFNNAAMAVEDSLHKQGGGRVLHHLYSLGGPTELGKYQFSVDGSSGDSLVATLWGFVKKPSEDVDAQDASVFEFASRNQRIEASVADKVAGTIVPLALRLIRSSVILMSITNAQTTSEMEPSLHTGIEILKQQHEVSSSPVVISNSSNIVKWVNTAYKQMIGQPECPWLLSLMHDSMLEGEEMQAQSPRLTGQVVLRCCVELPLSVSTFAGWVDVQWRNVAGERSSMTLPCDVTRRVCAKDGGSVLFVWKLDVQASLRL
ncbi:hypothetical protein GOP47_0015195 [Adiantum capillus-veneris]|uniref:DUF7950 domain-containing protein n=1 Tax=Adiantum capillus-veneris TaxID=13818 RepID=A0A9D4ZE81_ADICA|nr:hypothetical protein GOP47_0015195 [Adiantum capillus-veneris]